MPIKKVKFPNNTYQDIHDARNVIIGDGINEAVSLTTAEYEALQTKDPNTLYVITDAQSGDGGNIAYIGETIGSATYTADGIVVDLSDYQPLLVSGTNIKTINNQSLLGNGNLTIEGEENVIETVKVNGTALTPDANKAVDIPIRANAYVDSGGACLLRVEGLNVFGYNFIEGADGCNYAIGPENATGAEDYILAVTGQIPTESTVAGWGFTKNTGTYSKPSGGIPKTDLASAVQTSLGKADTALQSFTETDPVYSASAAAGITSSDITNWNGKTSNVGTITGITMNGSSKGTSGVVNLGTVVTSETDPVFTASAAHGISSTDITNWNAKQKAITVSSSEPTSSQGSNGDIWIVI